MTKGIQPWRRLVEVFEGAVILGLPFLRINGQSALRFDVPSLRLYFFGSTIWMDEFFIVLVAIIFLVLLFVFVTLMVGRVWCGWVCPQTVLIDYTGFFDKVKKRERERGHLAGAASYVAVLAVSIIVSASLIWYFVSPYEFIGRLLGGTLEGTVWGFWAVLSGVLFLNYAFVRHKWCATVCPYAKLQSVMFDHKTLVIAFDPSRKQECMNCMACVKTCPVGIDIRKGLEAACINCAKCIDECTNIMRSRGKKGLIGYFWGLPGETAKRMLRTNALVTGSLTAVSLVFLVYMAAIRTTLGLDVLPDYNFPPRLVQHEAVNSFVLLLENRGSEDEELDISAEGLNGAKVRPGRVLVKAGQEGRVQVYVIAGAKAMGGTKNMEMVIRSERTGKKLEQKAKFIYPGGGPEGGEGS